MESNILHDCMNHPRTRFSVKSKRLDEKSRAVVFRAGPLHRRQAVAVMDSPRHDGYGSTETALKERSEKRTQPLEGAERVSARGDSVAT